MAKQIFKDVFEALDFLDLRKELAIFTDKETYSLGGEAKLLTDTKNYKVGGEIGLFTDKENYKVGGEIGLFTDKDNYGIKNEISVVKDLTGLKSEVQIFTDVDTFSLAKEAKFFEGGPKEEVLLSLETDHHDFTSSAPSSNQHPMSDVVAPSTIVKQEISTFEAQNGEEQIEEVPKE
jgi:hypothetical protein